MSNMNETKNIRVDDKDVLVADLPKPIRDNVDMYDKVRDKIDALAYELNILNHAAISLNSRVLMDTAEYIKAVEQAQAETDAEADTEAAAAETKDKTSKKDKK